MIRIRKSPNSPVELAQHGYRNDAVRRAVHADQDGKCYLCERVLGTDIQVEHLQSQSHAPELVNVWRNLFLACSYCNGKKNDDYDGILDPAENNVEEMIRHTYDAEHDRFIFQPVGSPMSAVEKTIQLLDLVFNGANPRMLKLKEEAFRSDFQAALTRFNDTLSAYLMNPTEGTRSRVQADLSPQSEFLGFKYWIILSDEGLARVFSSDIVWNKS